MSTEGKGCLVEGRIVYTVGDLFTGDTAMVYGTKQPKLNKQGQQYKEYGFGLAVPKTILQDQANFAEGKPGHFWAVMHQVAASFYPSGVPQSFKMKWIDGDTGKLQDGTPVNTKKGYPENYVLSCKSTFPPKFFKWNPTMGAMEQVSSGIKCGDFVRVQLSVSGHTNANASLYLNPMMVLHLADGEEINNAPSATQVFGAAAPVAPSWMPQQAPMGIAPQMMQQPMQAPAPVQAHYGILPQVHQPQQQMAPPMPVQPFVGATAGAPMPAFPIPR